MRNALLSDAPLVRPGDDRLDRRRFAESLAHAILRIDADEGFVFALYGAWGSGKTTVLNFVLHFLNEDARPPVVVRFNPWWFSGSHDLLRRFFDQLAAVLKERRAAKARRFLGRRMRELGNLARAAGPLTPWSALGAAVMEFSGALLEGKKDVDAARARINDLLLHSERRIVIVIDDIDRLTSDEVRDVFRLVKAVADFPRTIYLLSFDPEAVVRALDAFQPGKGEGYLEKIVQSPFTLPVPDRPLLRRWLSEQIEGVLSGTPKDLWNDTEWGNVYYDGIDHFIRTPRDVKRYINACRASYAGLRGEVFASDLLAVEALRVFVPAIHGIVASSPDLFAGTPGRSALDQQNHREDKALYDGFLGAVPVEHQDAAKAILMRLFPRFAHAYGGSMYDPAFQAQWRQARRVRAPEVFGVFFQLLVPAGDISNLEMASLLETASNPAEFAEQLALLASQPGPGGQGTRVRPFLDRLRDYTEDSLPPERVAPILRALFEVGDRLATPADETGEFGIGNERRISWLVRILLNRLPHKHVRVRVLLDAMQSASSPFVVSWEAHRLESEHHGNYGQPDQVPPEDCTIPESAIPNLRQAALSAIERAASERRLEAAPQLGYVLHRWRELASSSAPQQYVASLAQTDEGSARLLDGFLLPQQSWGLTDRVARVTWRVRPSEIREFVAAFDDFVKRCRQLALRAPEWLTPTQNRAIEAFLDELDNPGNYRD